VVPVRNGTRLTLLSMTRQEAGFACDRIRTTAHRAGAGQDGGGEGELSEVVSEAKLLDEPLSRRWALDEGRRKIGLGDTSVL
jgi:hypothetical protein